MTIKPRPSLHEPPPPRELAREGGTVYEVRAGNVYRSLPDCLPHYYCTLGAWPQSSAARRLCGSLGGPRRTVEDALATDTAMAAEREKRRERSERKNADNRAKRRSG